MTVVPIQERVRVRVTPRGARFFELLRDGYDEMKAMRIATSEHGPRLVDAPARGKGAETEARAAELRDRIDKQVRDALTLLRAALDSSRISKARIEWLAETVAGGHRSGIIQ